MAKHTKEEVNYSPGMMHSHCGPSFYDDKFYCRHFIPRATRLGACEHVEGEIAPDMWCQLYQRTKKP